MKELRQFVLNSVRQEVATRARAGGCWVWQGRRGDRKGYVQVKINKTRILAHRLSYEAFYGPLDENEVVRHTCDNPPCVNPNHLTKGSKRQNSRDAVLRERFDTKLTWDDVSRIRALAFAGVRAHDLALKYDVSDPTILRIIKNESWTET